MVGTQPAVGTGVDLIALRMLCATAERGSLSAAGQSLGVTQQAVSARMRRLERSLGLVLLERSATGSRLTASGGVVAGWAADVLAAVEHLEQGAGVLRASGTADVTVAASLTIAECLLPRWLAALRSSFGPAHIAVTAANSEAVLDQVERGVQQLGFIEAPGAYPALRTLHIAWDELALVVSPAHSWARRRAVSAQELARTPLVSRESGSGTRQATEEALRRAGYEDLAPPLLELPSTAGIRTAVASGMGPAVLSQLSVDEDLAAGRLHRVRIRDIAIRRELRAVLRRGTKLAQPLRSLLNIARLAGATGAPSR